MKELSNKNSEFLQILKILNNLDSESGLRSYIWGGLTFDIWEGRFLREHHDIGALIENLNEKFSLLEKNFLEFGYEVKKLENGDFKAINGEAKIHIGNVFVDSDIAEWTHNGDKASMFFPRKWLNRQSYKFYDTKVFTVTPEFEFILKSQPEKIGFSGKREKDKLALKNLKILLGKEGVDVDELNKLVRYS